MDIKGRERKLEENGNAEMILWAKVHGSSETSGIGFWKLVAPVSVGSKRIRPVTHPTQSPFTLIHPHNSK
jgi:hypothetical protein